MQKAASSNMISIRWYVPLAPLVPGNEPVPARISSFDQKPDSGKMPDSARVAIRKVQNVLGILCRNPP